MNAYCTRAVSGCADNLYQTPEFVVPAIKFLTSCEPTPQTPSVKALRRDSVLNLQCMSYQNVTTISGPRLCIVSGQAFV